MVVVHGDQVSQKGTDAPLPKLLTPSAWGSSPRGGTSASCDSIRLIVPLGKEGKRRMIHILLVVV